MPTFMLVIGLSVVVVVLAVLGCIVVGSCEVASFAAGSAVVGNFEVGLVVVGTSVVGTSALVSVEISVEGSVVVEFTAKWPAGVGMCVVESIAVEFADLG